MALPIFDNFEAITSQIQQIKAARDREIRKEHIENAIKLIKDYSHQDVYKESLNIISVLGAIESILTKEILYDECRLSNDNLYNVIKVLEFTDADLVHNSSRGTYETTCNILLLEIDSTCFDKTPTAIQKESSKTDYHLSLLLDKYVNLDIRMYNAHNHTWTFNYSQLCNDNNLKIYKNNIFLLVYYINGIIKSCKLEMKISYKDNVYQKSDILIEFEYSKSIDAAGKTVLKLTKILFDTNELSFEELIKKIEKFEFSFPIQKEVFLDNNNFCIPFLREKNDPYTFSFPENFRTK